MPLVPCAVLLLEDGLVEAVELLCPVVSVLEAVDDLSVLEDLSPVWPVEDVP